MNHNLKSNKLNLSTIVIARFVPKYYKCFFLFFFFNQFDVARQVLRTKKKFTTLGLGIHWRDANHSHLKQQHL